MSTGKTASSVSATLTIFLSVICTNGVPFPLDPYFKGAYVCNLQKKAFHEGLW